MENKRYGMDDLLAIMARLRAPDGCPWDREQTHASIRRNLIDEAYEACEVIDLDDKALLCEELGDVLLQVVFHARIEEEAGGFDFTDVTDGVCRKLIERHPHIFGGQELKTGSSAEVLENWEAIKQRTKHNETGADALDAVARSLPALWRADKLLSRAERAGFAYPGETGEPAGFDETGDALFETVVRARRAGVDPEMALTAANDRFAARFRRAEERCGGFAGKSGEEKAAAWAAAGRTEEQG